MCKNARTTLIFSVLILCLAVSLTAQDKKFTAKTTGYHEALDMAVNAGLGKAYIVYSLGKAGGPTTDVMRVVIRYNKAKDRWQFARAPQALFLGEGKAPAALPANGRRDVEVANPVCAINTEDLERVEVTWSDLLPGPDRYRIRHRRMSKNGGTLGNVRILSSDTRVQFNGAIVNTRVGMAATYSRYADDFNQDDAGLIINFFDDPAPGTPDEQVLVPSFVQQDNRTGGFFPTTTVCIQGIPADPCDNLPPGRLTMGVNEILADTFLSGEHYTRGGILTCNIYPDGTVNNIDYFWFFPPSNLDGISRIINSPGRFNAFWVFSAGTTNVEYNITVTNTQGKTVNTFTNPLGEASQPITDTQAFATCPNVSAAAPDGSVYAVAYSKPQGRFLVREMRQNGTGLTGSVMKSNKIGKSVVRFVAEYVDGHMLIAYVDGLKNSNRLRIYDMNLAKR